MARRADLSHAAPKFHFEDRVGLLTAVAAQGFDELAQRLREVASTRPSDALEAMGNAYLDFALSNPALFDLMFRPNELRSSDLALRTAQQQAIAVLATSLDDSRDGEDAGASGETALISWVFIHGLAVLTKVQALSPPVDDGQPPQDAEALPHHLIEVFSRRVS